MKKLKNKFKVFFEKHPHIRKIPFLMTIVIPKYECKGERYLQKCGELLEDEDFYKMSQSLDNFIGIKGLETKDILQYKRFGKNYLLSLSLRKKIYYLLCFFGQTRLIRKLL